jgi:hypothetical protein
LFNLPISIHYVFEIGVSRINNNPRHCSTDELFSRRWGIIPQILIKTVSNKFRQNNILCNYNNIRQMFFVAHKLLLVSAKSIGGSQA